MSKDITPSWKINDEDWEEATSDAKIICHGLFAIHEAMENVAKALHAIANAENQINHD
jgi:hypothetical protein